MERRWLRAALASCVLLLSGCIMSDSLRHDTFSSVWSQPATTQPVFFVTDREAEGKVLDRHWGASLRCGHMEVPVPSGPYVANFEADFKSCEGQAALKAFVSEVAAAARQRGCNSVLLLVHGYNTTFRSALLRGGQVARDLQWPCATLLFSWSSEGQFNRYVADVERAGYAVPSLIQLLRQLGGQKLAIDILAHSMGTRVTLSALGAVCDDGISANALILAAPDVSAEEGNDDFAHLLTRIGPCSQHTTVYASEDDVALMFSESVHGGIPRAGRVPLQDLQYLDKTDCGKADCYGRVEVIDATLAPGDPVGHGYFALSYETTRDIMWALAGVAAADRAKADTPGGPTLTCLAAKGAPCGGRYALLITPERQEQTPSWLLKVLWSLIFQVR